MAVSRRTVLGAAAAGALLAAAPGLPQQPAPRAKGPRVWLDLDQAELDDAYDQSVYAPNQKQVTGRYVTNSDAVRTRLGAPRRFAYGPTPVEGLDVW
ncbi:MAG TPA: twin-arginine translocation signal domain-containing protein, partial [Burkholderiales bacterium]|nr:twin-arginine translocation signal domain-containing protein [Burkholderiales bacterium]